VPRFIRLFLVLAVAGLLPAAAQASCWHIQAGSVGLLVHDGGYSVLLPGPTFIFGAYGEEARVWGTRTPASGVMPLADLPGLLRGGGPEGDGLRAAATALILCLEGQDFDMATGPARNRHAVAFLADSVFACALPSSGEELSPEADLAQAAHLNAVLAGAASGGTGPDAAEPPPSPEAILAEAAGFNTLLRELVAPASESKAPARTRFQAEAPEGERPAKRHRPGV